MLTLVDLKKPTKKRKLGKINNIKRRFVLYCSLKKDLAKKPTLSQRHFSFVPSHIVFHYMCQQRKVQYWYKEFAPLFLRAKALQQTHIRTPFYRSAGIFAGNFSTDSYGVL